MYCPTPLPPLFPPLQCFSTRFVSATGSEVNNVVSHVVSHLVSHVVSHVVNHVVNHVVSHVVSHVALLDLRLVGLRLLIGSVFHIRAEQNKPAT